MRRKINTLVATEVKIGFLTASRQDFKRASYNLRREDIDGLVIDYIKKESEYYIRARIAYFN